MMSYPTPHTMASVTNRLATNSPPRTSSLRTVFLRCSTSHKWGRAVKRLVRTVVGHCENRTALDRPGIARSWLSFYESVNFLLPSRCPFPDPSPCPGRGQARLARAGEGSSHAVAYLHSGCAPRLQSLSLPISRSLALSEVVDFLDLGARAKS